jgi:ankyrin repeat protein
VFCQLDTLRRCIPASIRKALDELPITLDETYEKTLECIPREQRRHAHRLFQCLIAAIRPLRVDELTEIFAIQFDTKLGPNLMEGWRPEDPEEAVLTACSSLIAIVDVRGYKVVQFSHFSVKEFLTSDRLAASNVGNISQYHIPLEPAHSILAQACLTVLLQLDNETDKKQLGTFPLAFYAAQHWVDHAKFGSVASEVGDAMERLFDPKKSHLAAWTWIYDVNHWADRSMDDFTEHPRSPEATPLYYAALCGFTGLAKSLIIAHAEDVNAKCGYGGTPLHGACRGGQLECLQLLLEHGADIDAREDNQDAVLHLASLEGQVEVVCLLLQHNADVNAECSWEWTPLHHASSKGQIKVAQLILESGADVNAQDKDQDTPLHLASRRGHLEFVRLLLGHGADVHIRGSESRTPFQQATEGGHHEIAQLLLEHGAQRQ